MSFYPWFPIHLHCVPKTMISASFKGMMISAEWRKSILTKTYSFEGKWPQREGDRLLFFFKTGKN